MPIETQNAANERHTGAGEVAAGVLEDIGEGIKHVVDGTNFEEKNKFTGDATKQATASIVNDANKVGGESEAEQKEKADKLASK